MFGLRNKTKVPTLTEEQLRFMIAPRPVSLGDAEGDDLSRNLLALPDIENATLRSQDTLPVLGTIGNSMRSRARLAYRETKGF